MSAPELNPKLRRFVGMDTVMLVNQILLLEERVRELEDAAADRYEEDRAHSLDSIGWFGR